MIGVIAELLLVIVVGIAMIVATFITADISGDWLTQQIRRLYQRIQAAKVRMGWWEVAARHRRKVKA